MAQAAAMLVAAARGATLHEAATAVQDELIRLQNMEQRATAMAALGMPTYSPHYRPVHDPSAAVFAARHILEEADTHPPGPPGVVPPDGLPAPGGRER